MRIEVRSGTEPLAHDERTFVDRAVALALGRFRPKLALVAVTVEPEAAPGGGDPLRRVSVRLDGDCRLLVLERDRDFESAVVRALDRTRRYLEREAARLAWRRRAQSSARLAWPPRGGEATGRRRAALATREDDLQ